MSSTSNGTGTVAGPASTGNDAMERLIRDAQKARDWILIAPNGRMYVTNKPEELFAVLAPHHPLLKATKEQP